MSIKSKDTDPRAMIVKSIMRYATIILIAWLALKFADVWIVALIEKVAA